MATLRRASIFLLGSLSLLIIPAGAMILGISGWQWGAEDYAATALLVIGLGIALAVATDTKISRVNRLTSVAVLLFLFGLYVHLAVGILPLLPLSGS